MCGIAGVFYRDGAPADERVLSAMAATLNHRGPDGHGVKTFPGAGLAQTRLKIIDLTEAAAQPMPTPDGKSWIAFNGEIYNFRELRAPLEAKGHVFRGTGDTEVIAHLYAEQGVDAIARLDGMFALAIWDEKNRRLVLARDRTGKKPLYVYDDGKKVVFGSEIKAILAHPGVDDGLWDDALPLYLTYGYVPTPRTHYAKIRKLPPASVLVIEEGKENEPVAFWDFPIVEADGGATEPASALQARLRDLFTAAVKRRMVADVPLGAFLSGGVDSTLVVGVMSRLSSRPVKTFSIGFEGDASYDETRYARMAAQAFGTEHTEFRVEPRSWDLVEKLSWHYDEPFGDSSAIPTYIVSELTRRHVTVALTGDGGDELFAGYGRFHAARLAETMPRPLMRALERLTRPVPAGDNFRSVVNRGKRFLARASQELPERFRTWISFFTLEELSELLSPELARRLDGSSIAASYSGALERAGKADLINRLLYLNARTYLLDDLNVKMDRASMAASLEARAPFLDTALIEFAFSLPGSFKLKGRTTKWILKEAFRDLLPPAIRTRRKMGFGVPLGAWFRGELKSFLESRLLDPKARIYPLLRREFVERMFAEHQARHRDWGGHFWVLSMLELWLDRRAGGASGRR